MEIFSRRSKMKHVFFGLLICGSFSLALPAQEPRTPEQTRELIHDLFGEVRFRESNDVIRPNQKRISIEEFLENWRTGHNLEKKDMCELFIHIIQEQLSKLEENSDENPSTEGYIGALRYIKYYPPSQDQFLKLVQKTVALDPETAEIIIFGYIEKNPDWFLNDEPIVEMIRKTQSKTRDIRTAHTNLRNQLKKETDEARKKKILDTLVKWAFQDENLFTFSEMDRFLLDTCEKEYASLPARKAQLKKVLDDHEKREYYDWVYRRTKYALEHFGEGGESLKMLYRMDTDQELRIGDWERAVLEKKRLEWIKEAEKVGVIVNIPPKNGKK